MYRYVLRTPLGWFYGAPFTTPPDITDAVHNSIGRYIQRCETLTDDGGWEVY